jgi:hypothetical protein
MREEMRRLQQGASDGDASGSSVPPTTTGGGASSEPRKEAEKPGRQEAPPLPYLGDPDPDDQRAESSGVLVQALDEIGPNDASSFPLPLIVLGGLFGLLLIAGGVGYLARRSRPPSSGRYGVHGPR